MKGVRPLFPALALLAMACGPRRGQSDYDDDVWQCHERAASYLLVGSLAGPEVGVALDCAERGPRIRRWVVNHKGIRDEQSHVVSEHAFDNTWDRIEGAGWRFTKDCGKPDSPTEPVYTFDIKDWNNSVSFSCAGRGKLPYPYGPIVDELDLAARGMTGGDDGE